MREDIMKFKKEKIEALYEDYLKFEKNKWMSNL